MDKNYWNRYYKEHPGVKRPSGFAKAVLSYMEPGRKVVDIGCGDGRDSLYFLKRRMEVYAVDASESAISRLEQMGESGIRVFNQDFVDFLEENEEEFDYLYSRFTIHAITLGEQERLLKAAFRSLGEGGRFFIEVRCVLDELYGKGELLAPDTYFYGGHSRRFVRKEEFEEALLEEGFEIYDSRQERGFAPFQGSDPLILRVIAGKPSRSEGESKETGN